MLNGTSLWVTSFCAEGITSTLKDTLISLAHSILITANTLRQNKSWQEELTDTAADIARRAEDAPVVTFAQDFFVPIAAASVWAATLYPVVEVK